MASAVNIDDELPPELDWGIVNHRRAEDRLERAKKTYVAKVLASVPSPGTGYNPALPRIVASVGWAFENESECLAELTRKLPRNTGGELERAVKRVYATSVPPPWWEGDVEKNRPTVRLAPDPAKQWSAVNVEAMDEIFAKDPLTLEELTESSPVTPTSERMTNAILDSLFPGDPLLCIGKSKTRFLTKLKSEFETEFSTLPFLVPNIMAARQGLTADKTHWSAKTNANSGTRRYVVVEFDFDGGSDGGGLTPHKKCSALLGHLRKTFAEPKLRLVVSSGGKSLHSWWDCTSIDLVESRAFYDAAVSLGADPACWVPSQFVRMPDGTRENGNRQQVIFFDDNNYNHNNQ